MHMGLAVMQVAVDDIGSVSNQFQNVDLAARRLKYTGLCIL